MGWTCKEISAGFYGSCLNGMPKKLFSALLIFIVCILQAPPEYAASRTAVDAKDSSAQNTVPPGAGRITKRRLGPGINTPYTEILPIADASGDRLYFTRANYPDPSLRAYIEKNINDRLAKCKSVNVGAVEQAMKKVGGKLSAADRKMLETLSSSCDNLEKTRDRDLYNYDRSAHPNQVYVSERQRNGIWSKAKRLPAPLNDETFTNVGNVAIVSASPDRHTLLLLGDLLFGRQRVDGCIDLATMLGARQVECLPIAIARYNGTAWVREDRLRTEPFKRRLNVSGAALAPDGRTIILSARDKNTNSDNHNRLMVTRWNEVSHLWSAPEEIETLNGPFENVSPFIGPDGRSLYFASDRPGGQGKLDLYLSRRQGSNWRTWSKPENLGPDINSKENDLSISVDASGRYAFMAAGKGAQTDIYEFNLPPNLSPAPTAIVGGLILLGDPLTGEPSSNLGVPHKNMLLLPRGGIGGGAGGGGGGAGRKGQQRDGQSVVFVRLSDNIVVGQSSLASSGGALSYEMRLPVGGVYAAYVSAAGYAGISQVIDLTNAAQDQHVEQNLAITRLVPGAVIRLNNVYFETNSAKLLPKSRMELNRLVLMLGRYPTMQIEIAGHTDSRSSDEYNLHLSDRRAASVRAYLEDAGVVAKRLQSHGYGESQPIATNTTKKGRALNRRVEFRILKM